MKLDLYRVLHVSGLIALVSALSIVLTSDQKSKLANMVLGVASLVMVIAGFGLLHLTGADMHSRWVMGKLLIWLFIAIAVPVIAKRKPEWRRGTFGVTLVLLVAAVVLAIFKP
ncbi:hypothetical protein EB093_03310 [bacterium]|nr:hypothetical protein [bacterium]